MAGRLKPLDVERQTKPGKYADGDGLYLIITGPTSKSWSYRYWKDGKERWHGLGSLKDVSLKDARLARDAARLRVKGDRTTPGVDVVQERRKAREEAKAVEAKVVLPTFEECAEAYIRANWSTWSEKHRDQWPSSLKRYAYPTIGKLTTSQIKPSHIHDLLKPIWVEKRETANRVRAVSKRSLRRMSILMIQTSVIQPSLRGNCARSYRSAPSGSSAIIQPYPTPRRRRS
ncbi:Arm DNA-binding domain-containing protein [Bradyrhizobium sp. RT7b]|uniref:tyrosine-type recombinase/integrase n=1 Tax=unclassified Bradyrhizobium TaxID=2631580 RepID=UPI003396AD75